MGKTFELLNPDEHGHILRKHGRELGNCRPDITHQCLLMLFDSPLNRAGLLQVYIHTENNVLIEINPQTRIPRTFKRFAGLMGEFSSNFNSAILLNLIFYYNSKLRNLSFNKKSCWTIFLEKKLFNIFDELKMFSTTDIYLKLG